MFRYEACGLLVCEEWVCENILLFVADPWVFFFQLLVNGEIAFSVFLAFCVARLVYPCMFVGFLLLYCGFCGVF